MKNLKNYLLVYIIVIFFFQCKLEVSAIKRVDLLVVGFSSTKQIEFTEKIVREKCSPVVITDSTFLNCFGRELEKSKEVVPLKTEFSWDAICDIYFFGEDTVSLYISKSYMVFRNRVFKRNENLVKCIEKILKQYKSSKGY